MAPNRRNLKQAPHRRKRQPGKYFERATSRVLAALRGQTRVHSNVTLRGKLSEVGRQVDVQLVDPNVYDFVALECKDHARPVDVPLIEAFSTKLIDVGAAHGAVVSNSGYTEGAVKMAAKLGIDTLALVDTDDPAIKTQVAATILTRDLYVHGIFATFAAGGHMPANADELILVDEHDRELSSAEVVKDAWNARRIPHALGDHQLALVRWGFRAWRTPADNGAIPGLLLSVRIAERCHVGGLQLLNSEGLYDVHSGTYETRSLVTEPWSAEKAKNWVELTSDEADVLESLGGVSATLAMSSPAVPRIAPN